MWGWPAKIQVVAEFRIVPTKKETLIFYILKQKSDSLAGDNGLDVFSALYMYGWKLNNKLFPERLE